MIFTTIHIIWTVMLVLIFIGIAFWAWSSSPKDRFKEASLLPFDKDQPDHSEPEQNNE